MEVLQECIKNYGIRSFIPYVTDIWSALRTEITISVVTDIIEPSFSTLKLFTKCLDELPESGEENSGNEQQRQQ